MSAKHSIVDGKKQCSKCGIWKFPVDYCKSNATSSGLSSQCKVCRYADRDERKKADPDYNEKHRPRRAVYRLKQRYGLTVEEYQSLLDSQENCCAICRRILDKQSTNLYPCIDHSHLKGHVRGILCQPCNLGLGAFADNIDRLYSAINYLKENG